MQQITHKFTEVIDILNKSKQTVTFLEKENTSKTLNKTLKKLKYVGSQKVLKTMAEL